MKFAIHAFHVKHHLQLSETANKSYPTCSVMTFKNQRKAINLGPHVSCKTEAKFRTELTGSRCTDV